MKSRLPARLAICRAKVPYGTREAAQQARWRASHRQRLRQRGRWLRTYRCSLCGEWHLTTKRGSRSRPAQFDEPDETQTRR